MTALILRFRDLTIPDGESIRRHRAKIEEHQRVWWGWIMRGHETVPKGFLSGLADELEVAPRKIYLFHSTERRLYPAMLREVSAFPGGDPVQTPEVHKTPSYMAEAELPAWFQLQSIADPLEKPFRIRVTGLPTLTTIEKPVDKILLERDVEDLGDLFLSTATLWTAIVEGAAHDVRDD